jgi:hypothetical protein
MIPSIDLDHRLSYSWSPAYTGELVDASTGRPTSGYVDSSILNLELCLSSIGVLVLYQK